MGLYAWWRQRRGGGPRAGNDAGPLTRLGMRPGTQVAGLDFYQAIESLRHWKLRLAAYVRGEARPSQGWSEVGRDDRCVLGRWLQEASSAHPLQAERLARLRAQHTALHQEAEAVVRLADRGQRDAALHALRHGAFAQASHATVAGLSELFVSLHEPASPGYAAPGATSPRNQKP